MKRFISIALVLMLLMTVISGCGNTNNQNDQPANDQPANDQPEKPGDDDSQDDTATSVKDTLTIGITADPASFSPLDSTMMIELRLYENFYDTLLEVDLKGNLVPSLAESWEISDDGLTYQFNLRQGVKFQNGDELVASDVVYTFNELYKASPNYFDLSDIFIEAIEIDPYTVKITLNSPTGTFLAELASMGYIFSQNHHQSVGDDMRSQPMGTGAYMYKERVLGSRIVLERFDDHFKGKAPIETVVYRVLPDANTLVVALEAGDIDYTDGIPLASKSILEGNNRLTLKSMQGIRLDWVAMNTEKSPFNEVKVRQAVNYALNREFWNDVIFEGEGIPWDAMYMPGMIAAPDNIPRFDYDIEKAKTLLAEAGYPNGFTVSEPILATAATAQAAEILQASLMDVGIMTEIQTLEFSTYIGQYRGGEFSLAIAGFFFITPDTNLPASVYRIGQIGVMNNARYVNEEVDSLLAQALLESDVNIRRDLYNQAYTIAQTEAPYAAAIIPPAIIAHDAQLVVENANARNIRLYNFSWK